MVNVPVAVLVAVAGKGVSVTVFTNVLVGVDSAVLSSVGVEVGETGKAGVEGKVADRVADAEGLADQVGVTVSSTVGESLGVSV